MARVLHAWAEDVRDGSYRGSEYFVVGRRMFGALKTRGRGAAYWVEG
jgi:hypothetical protein